MAIDKLSHVKAQLATISGKLRPKYEHNSVKVCCPFHAGGREKTPSCSVRLTGGIGSFYCFGCHEKGNWNVLANALNLVGFKKSDQINDVFSFSIPEVNYSEVNPEIENYKKLRKYNSDDNWRRITPETLALFDVRYPKHPWFNQNDFLYFPAIVRKEYVGGIYARRNVTKEGKENGEISYINTKGRWSKTSVFGYNVAKKMKGPLWVVEGPRDCMKIVQFGGRAVAIIGSYVGPKKLQLIESLDPPCIIIATDPDEAGDKARKYLLENISMIPVYEAKFPEGRDPGNFTKKSYAKMMKKLGLAEWA